MERRRREGGKEVDKTKEKRREERREEMDLGLALGLEAGELEAAVVLPTRLLLLRLLRSPSSLACCELSITWWRWS